MNKKTAAYILLAFFLAGVIYVTANLSVGRTQFFGKAAGAGIVSPQNSYVFLSPVAVKAPNEKIRLTVFALDGQGRGIVQKRALVACKEPDTCQSLGVVFNDVQPNTDNIGQAIFDISAKEAGKIEIQTTVNNVKLPQTVTAVFQ